MIRFGARASLVLVASLFGVLFAACGGDDDDRALTVFAAASLADVFREIGQQFETDNPGVNVLFDFGGSQRLRLQLEQGARADVWAAADVTEMERAMASAVVQPPITTFAINEIGLVVPASNPAGITGVTDFTERQVRLVIAGEAVSAGRATRAAVAAAGVLAGVLESVVSEEDNVRAVLTKVEAGEVDAGFVYRTDALSAGDAVCWLPLDAAAAAAGAVEYQIALTADPRETDLAARFVALVESAQAQTVLSTAGFTPARNEE